MDEGIKRGVNSSDEPIQAGMHFYLQNGTE